MFHPAAIFVTTLAKAITKRSFLSLHFSFSTFPPLYFPSASCHCPSILFLNLVAMSSRTTPSYPSPYLPFFPLVTGPPFLHPFPFFTLQILFEVLFLCPIACFFFLESNPLFSFFFAGCETGIQASGHGIQGCSNTCLEPVHQFRLPSLTMDPHFCRNSTGFVSFHFFFCSIATAPTLFFFVGARFSLCREVPCSFRQGAPYAQGTMHVFLLVLTLVVAVVHRL